MRYLSVEEVVSLHSLLISQSGGSSGLRDSGALESAVAQPEASFGGQPLYPMISDKAAALGFSLIRTIPLSMGTNVWGMLRWKYFLYSMGMS